MAIPRHLPRAPIKEALIDLQIVTPPGLGAEPLDSNHADLSASYPRKDSVLKGQFGVHFEHGKAVKTTLDQDLIGFRYTSADAKQVVQFRTDGFTFSRLEPYQTWEQMREEAKRLWKAYSALASPTVIKRVATRYINVLPLPVPIVGLADYLEAPPKLPPEGPRDILSFLTQLIVTESSSEATVIVNQAMGGKDANRFDVVLDIDVFVERQFDVSEDHHWQVLEHLRDMKNRIFFGSLTERAMELFG